MFESRWLLGRNLKEFHLKWANTVHNPTLFLHGGQVSYPTSTKTELSETAVSIGTLQWWNSLVSSYQKERGGSRTIGMEGDA